jgi:hypothetical protein
MSEDETEPDTEEITQMVRMMENSSDSTLILNLISPYLAGERKGKLNKLNRDLIEIIQILVVNQMKLQNDFRALLMYLNKRELLDVDDQELPTFSKVSPESMYM